MHVPKNGLYFKYFLKADLVMMMNDLLIDVDLLIWSTATVCRHIC